MRSSIALILAGLLAGAAARADDTRAPSISDVKSSVSRGAVTIEARITDETGVLSAVCHHRGKDGAVHDTRMVKSGFEDVFRATFPVADTEYWIEATDLLGNGPATYGTAGKPMAVVGAPPELEPQIAKAPRQKEPQTKPPSAAPPSGPVVEHRRPTGATEGQDLVLQARIRSSVPVATAGIQARPSGGGFTTLPMARTDGEAWEGKIPASMAKGTVEYYVVAKTGTGQQTRQGEQADTPFVVTFKPGAPQAVAGSGGESKGTGPYDFTHLPLHRIEPNRPLLLRAQIVPAGDGSMPETVAVLWRGNDATDQMTEMVKDPSGGWGGFRAEIPAQQEGALFYQVIACDAAGSKCGVDTGSKRRWHAAAVASQPGTGLPLPLEAVSSRAPPSLPE